MPTLVFRAVMRVLLIEDFPLIRKSVAIGLREAWFAFDDTVDGE